MILLFPIIGLVAGFIVIYLSADQFIDNSAKIANIYKVKPLIIGIVILGFGTSAPEMFVSGWAAFKEHPGLSVGNAFGSNIFNIALVLGITAIIKPIKLEFKTIRFELVILILFTLIAGFLLLHDDFNSMTFNGSLSSLDGFILLGLLGIFLWYTFRESKKVQLEYDIGRYGISYKNEDSEKKWKLWRDLVFWLIVLVGSAQLIVISATFLANYYHVSDLIFGLTVVALGTSIPELAVSVRGAVRKQHEMVVGNIIGSNIFNTVAVLAIPALISTSDIALVDTPGVSGLWPTYSVFFLDFGVMLLLTVGIGLFLFVPGIGGKKTHQISQVEGIFFIVVLIAYLSQRLLLL